MCHSSTLSTPTVQLQARLLSPSLRTNVSHAHELEFDRTTADISTACFGFLLSFYTNPWIAKSGYTGAVGAMAGISGVVLLMWVPLYIWGRQIRMATLKWRLVQNLIGWDKDRETGE